VRRVSPSEALELRCQRSAEPMQAAADLTNAIHTRMAFRVWCNGVVVKAHMRPDIRVVARLGGDGQWTAEIASISNQWPGQQYRWEFAADDVRELPPKPRPKRVRRRWKRPRPPEAPEPGKSRQQEACKQFVARKYPDGHDLIETGVIIGEARHDKEFRQKVVPFPNRDVWLRALGRRKG
jgi:hypothetical protein